MSDTAINVLINIGIGIIVVIGFVVYINRTEGWFKEGGLIYEWFKEQRNKKKDNEDKNNEDE